ncbi:MAG: hypothetical protein ACREAB_19135 [Blastocatellia bacterium]
MARRLVVRYCLSLFWRSHDDLILVNANPLADVGAAAQRSGVMVRGRWLPEAGLQAKLTELANLTAKK